MAPAAVISLSEGRRAGPALRLLGDRHLGRLASKGDPRAFAAIYERHHQDLYRYCRSITNNAEDASDALQSTMAAALRSLPGERRDVALRPWLFRVAHNESVTLIRRRRPAAELKEDSASTAPGPHGLACMRERLSILVESLRDLPERKRGALVMRELNGLDYGDIALALGISGSAARQAVYEARLALTEFEEGRDMSIFGGGLSQAAGASGAAKSAAAVVAVAVAGVGTVEVARKTVKDPASATRSSIGARAPQADAGAAAAGLRLSARHAPRVRHSPPTGGRGDGRRSAGADRGNAQAIGDVPVRARRRKAQAPVERKISAPPVTTPVQASSPAPQAPAAAPPAQPSAPAVPQPWQQHYNDAVSRYSAGMDLAQQTMQGVQQMLNGLFSGTQQR